LAQPAALAHMAHGDDIRSCLSEKLDKRSKKESLRSGAAWLPDLCTAPGVTYEQAANSTHKTWVHTSEYPMNMGKEHHRTILQNIANRAMLE
jgi:hypothetical protein